jgi:hypothetical protein
MAKSLASNFALFRSSMTDEEEFSAWLPAQMDAGRRRMDITSIAAGEWAAWYGDAR